MTTQGVHRYVLGILRELGIAEETITKVQTGGPDGDLGSNEILVSADRTIAVVDGGGVALRSRRPGPGGAGAPGARRAATAPTSTARSSGRGASWCTVRDRDVDAPGRDARGVRASGSATPSTWTRG